MIRFACPACQTVLQSPDPGAGNKVACPKCGQRLQIPGAPARRNRTVLGALLPKARPKVVVQPPEGAAPSPHKGPAPAVPQPPGRSGRKPTMSPAAPEREQPNGSARASRPKSRGSKSCLSVVVGAALGLVCFGVVGGAVWYFWPAAAAALRGAPDSSPVASRGDTGQAPRKPPEKPPASGTPAAPPLTYQAVKWGMIHQAYKDNEAAADANYLHKGFQFTACFYPGGVEKDQMGRYYAWESMVDAPGKKYPHLVLYFRKDAEVASLPAGVWTGTQYTIRGVCAGKRGTVPTLVAGVVQSYPTVVFEDCELVQKPPDAPVNKPLDKPGEKPAEKPADRPADKPADKPDPTPVITLVGSAAYGEYLDKRVQFTCRPQGVHRDDAGVCCAWQYVSGMPHKFYFRADQGAVVAEVRAGRGLTVRGVYAGKTGRGSAATFKDCELVSAPGAKPAEKPPDKPAEKPLLLAELVARLAAQVKEEVAAQRSGNFNMADQVRKALESERASWKGKPVKGEAEVLNVTGVEVQLFLKKDARRGITISAWAEDIDDPLLDKLKRGQVVELQGVLERQPALQDTTLTIKDCTFAPKK
jgi:hypothetical protein